jgi:2,3-bisphosphoglycerate-dependent phosphoglycerate mutase
MTPPVRLLLARHGRTEWHRDNRYVSRTDIGLNETGRREAWMLARRAEEERPDLVLCSPLTRALETARLSAEACDMEPRTDERLRELDFGEWEGKSLAEIREEDSESVSLFEEDPARHGFPGGEPLHKGAERVLEILAELHRSHTGQTVLVVAHNTLLRLGLCRMLGIPVRDYRRRLPRLVNAAVSEVRFGGEGGALYTLNDAKHLQRRSEAMSAAGRSRHGRVEATDRSPEIGTGGRRDQGKE